MTALTRTPINPNSLHPNKFQLNFSRAPNIQYFCQTLSMPGISLSEAIQQTPFVDLYVPGEKAIYDLLNVTFIIDETLQSWLEIHDWIRAMTFPEKYEEYKTLPSLYKKSSGAEKPNFPQYADCTVTLLSSANLPQYKFVFYDCFPTTLSSFVISTTDSPDNVITADATFRYSYYDIQKLS
jgi:hypothetical protein